MVSNTPTFIDCCNNNLHASSFSKNIENNAVNQAQVTQFLNLENTHHASNSMQV